MGKFAERVQTLAPSPILSMIPIISKLKNEGVKVHSLFIGQPGIPCYPEFTEAVKEKLNSGMSVYSPIMGETKLIDSYVEYYNDYLERRGLKHPQVEGHNVVVTVGGSAAALNTLLAIVNPDDEILAVEPTFPQYIGQCEMCCGKVKAIPTKIEENFALPSDEVIESKINSKTRAIIINSPNNPTGKIFSYEEIQRLAKICVKHNIYLISDEVYKEVILGDEEAVSLLHADLGSDELNKRYHELLVVIDSVSKIFSLCGARVGFVIASKSVAEKIALVGTYNYAAVSDLIQYGVAESYKTILKDRSFIDAYRKLFRERLDIALETLKEYLPDAIIAKPKGAFYLVVKIKEIKDVPDFCVWALQNFKYENETVAVASAGEFYVNPDDGQGQIRLALVLPTEQIRRSIEIFARAVKAYLNSLKRE